MITPEINLHTDNIHLQKVKKKFIDYLEGHKLRKTPERFAILGEIYAHDGHFNADALYRHMTKQNYRVSRATVYNTLELLEECKLIRKHQFGDTMAQYERLLGFEDHDHIICTKCGNVIEFSDDRITKIKNELAQKHGISIENHAFNIFGTCC